MKQAANIDPQAYYKISVKITADTAYRRDGGKIPFSCRVNVSSNFKGATATFLPKFKIMCMLSFCKAASLSNGGRELRQEEYRRNVNNQ